MKPLHAFSDDALGEDDVVGLVRRLRAGEVTSSELVEASIARIEAVDPELGAVAVRDYDRARDLAGRQDARPGTGWFAGVPVVLKDNIDVQGLPTQQGTDAFVAPPSPANGDTARLFEALGTVTLAKTRLSEFGFSAACDHPRQGPVRNPWNRNHYAGASSSGAGALVSSGAVPFAHGNDGGGSIRIPASVTGLVGLKPTRGRVPSDLITRQMPVRLVADGVLTRSVRDTAAFLRESERIYRNRSLPRVGGVTRPVEGNLRIAVVTDGIGRSASPEVRELTLKTAAMLEGLGHTVDEIPPPIPDWFADQFLLYWSMLSMFLVRTGPGNYPDTWDRSRLDNLTSGLARHCEKNLHRLPAAIAAIGMSKFSSARHYDTYDITLTPTLATETPRVGHLDPTADYEQVIDRLMDWVAFTPLQNATGDPAISLPLATTAAGLPQGMQLCAGRGNEALLLSLSLQLEQAHPWARIGP